LCIRRFSPTATMPKWKSSYDSNRKYNPNWEKQFVWLKKGGHHRLPSAHNLFKSLSYLSPNQVLNQVARNDFRDMPMLHLVKDKLDAVEEQYRKVLFLDWQNEPYFKCQDLSKLLYRCDCCLSKIKLLLIFLLNVLRITFLPGSYSLNSTGLTYRRRAACTLFAGFC